MNPDDVQGRWVQANISTQIKDESFLRGFSVIIANELHDDELSELSTFCDVNKIKFVAIQTNGFYGELRL